MKNIIKNVINRADRCFGLRALMQNETQTVWNLEGDRAIEWSWMVSHLPKQAARVLDFGCVQSSLSAIAARLGHAVTAVDLRDIEYEMEGVRFRKGHINKLDFTSEQFDVIMNCSTVEHVGLEGRYAGQQEGEGDLEAMRRLRSLLAEGGIMILTIPVGRDAVFSPFHRIYGEMRIKRLLQGFAVLDQEFWAKDASYLWKKCDRQVALATTGSNVYYALGLFLLRAN